MTSIAAPRPSRTPSTLNESAVMQPDIESRTLTHKVNMHLGCFRGVVGPAVAWNNGNCIALRPRHFGHTRPPSWVNPIRTCDLSLPRPPTRAHSHYDQASSPGANAPSGDDRGQPQRVGPARTGPAPSSLAGDLGHCLSERLVVARRPDGRPDWPGALPAVRGPGPGVQARAGPRRSSFRAARRRCRFDSDHAPSTAATSAVRARWPVCSEVNRIKLGFFSSAPP